MSDGNDDLYLRQAVRNLPEFVPITPEIGARIREKNIPVNTFEDLQKLLNEYPEGVNFLARLGDLDRVTYGTLGSSIFGPGSTAIIDGLMKNYSLYASAYSGTIKHEFEGSRVPYLMDNVSRIFNNQNLTPMQRIRDADEVIRNYIQADASLDADRRLFLLDERNVGARISYYFRHTMPHVVAADAFFGRYQEAAPTLERIRNQIVESMMNVGGAEASRMYAGILARHPIKGLQMYFMDPRVPAMHKIIMAGGLAGGLITIIGILTNLLERKRPKIINYLFPVVLSSLYVATGLGAFGDIQAAIVNSAKHMADRMEKLQAQEQQQASGLPKDVSVEFRVRAQ